MAFAPGTPALRRHYMRGHDLSRVWAGHVAADDEQGLWLYFATGSPWRNVGAADGRTFREVPFTDWGRVEHRLYDGHWNGDVLMLHPPDAPYSVWFFYTGPNDEFTSWYVNLERPGVRWRNDDGLVGLDTVDYDLDIVVAPDRTWRWKDEDEFLDHLAVPENYWCDDEAAVRASGADVVKLIEAGAFPFDGSNVDFRPDPGWVVPTAIPAGWDRPRAW
jgi:hypothetical protein